MIKVNPREAAASALFDILEEGGYNNAVLKRTLAANGVLSAEDKGFVTDCVNGTLRNILNIDYILEKVSSMKIKKMKPYIRTVLRMSVYQLRFMGKSPYAVVDEAVKLVKKRKMQGLAPFVNGVLRKISERPELFEIQAKTPSERISLTYSHPLWVVKAWVKAYGAEFTEKLCAANNTPPKITLAANSLLCGRDELAEDFASLGAKVEESAVFPNILRISAAMDISRTESFKKGFFHVMDEASAAAVFALNPKAGERILDICAAPGGKSLLAAQLMGNSGEIVSRDISAVKLEMLEDTADRLKINIIHTEERDATVPYEEDFGAFDAVLVDAPCSGLGLLRKKPDIRLKKSAEDVEALSQLQRSILKTAAGYVKAGGRLLYSTCTLTKEENRENFLWFLENFPFEAVDLNEVLPEKLCGKSAKYGYTELFPHIHGTDGFFISLAVKKG